MALNSQTIDKPFSDEDVKRRFLKEGLGTPISAEGVEVRSAPWEQPEMRSARAGLAVTLSRIFNDGSEKKADFYSHLPDRDLFFANQNAQFFDSLSRIGKKTAIFSGAAGVWGAIGLAAGFTTAGIGTIAVSGAAAVTGVVANRLSHRKLNALDSKLNDQITNILR